MLIFCCCFFEGGVRVLGENLVKCGTSANTAPCGGTVALVMQHFGGVGSRSDAAFIGASSATKKLQQMSLENSLGLVNFAPFASIR